MAVTWALGTSRALRKGSKDSQRGTPSPLCSSLFGEKNLLCEAALRHRWSALLAPPPSRLACSACKGDCTSLQLEKRFCCETVVEREVTHGPCMTSLPCSSMTTSLSDRRRSCASQTWTVAKQRRHALPTRRESHRKGPTDQDRRIEPSRHGHGRGDRTGQHEAGRARCFRDVSCARLAAAPASRSGRQNGRHGVPPVTAWNDGTREFLFRASSRHPNVRIPSVEALFLRELHLDRRSDCDAATRVSNASYHLAVVASMCCLARNPQKRAHRSSVAVSIPLPSGGHKPPLFGLGFA